jgi:chaperonin GroEL (HSP60 family)
MTSLAGKTNETVRALLSDLAVEAAHAVAQISTDSNHETTHSPSNHTSTRADPAHIKRLGARGGIASDTRLINGLMLPKRRLDQRTAANSSNGKIMLLDGGIAPRSPNIQAQIKVTEAGALAKFIEREKAEMQNRIGAIGAIGCDLLIVRDGIDDDAVSMLREAGIVTYRRVERDDLDLLSRATGATLIRDPLRARESDLGDFESRTEKKIDDIEHVTIIGSKIAGQTLLVRGATETMIAEVQRGFNDAIGVACGLIEEPRIVPGGGATWIALARALRSRAAEADGREQLAVEAYAAALEVIPRVLAENAGLDPLEMLLATSAKQAANDNAWLGLDLANNSTADMAKAGIIEPIRIARQAIAGATESAISVLRIDDVLWAKQDAQTPDWQTDVESDD